jgi:hypothetical protein
MKRKSKVTPAKRAANHAKAQKSTGPRTAIGKRTSRMNGLRHGLRAELARLAPGVAPASAAIPES